MPNRSAMLVHERLAIVDPAGGAQPLRLGRRRAGAGGQRRDLQPPRAAGRARAAVRVPDRLGLRGRSTRCTAKDGAGGVRASSTASSPSRCGMRPRGAYVIARDPIGVCPLYWGHDARRPAVGRLGDEGARARLRRRRGVPARALLRQRDRRAGALLRSARGATTTRRRASKCRPAANCATRFEARRAPPADERRAVRRAAVGRPGFVAGRRRARRASRAAASRTTTAAKPGGRGCIPSRSAWRARPTWPPPRSPPRRSAPCTTASPTPSRKASTRCPT